MSGEAGKGHKQRPCVKSIFDSNMDKIFGVKEPEYYQMDNPNKQPKSVEYQLGIDINCRGGDILCFSEVVNGKIVDLYRKEDKNENSTGK